MNKQRESNIELLRLIAIFLIILGHLSWETQLASPKTLHDPVILIRTFWIGGKFGVNIFMLITSYFLISKERINNDSLKKLWYTVSFWSLLILLISIIMNLSSISISLILKSIFPVILNNYWYVTVYCMIYIIHPILNKVIKFLSKKDLETLLVFGFFYLFIAMNIFSNQTAGTGDTFITLLYVYFLGSYLRLYDIPKKLEGKQNILIVISLLMVFIMVSSVYAISYCEINKFITEGTKKYGHFLSGSSPFQLILSMSIFICFINIKINHSNFINIFAKTTLVIYMVHTNYLVKDYIFNDLFKTRSLENTYWVIPYAIVMSFILLVVIGTVELMRIRIVVMLKKYLKVGDRRES